ncbi:MAG: arsenosugar biosynthesis radical SAM protein ArsS [Gammaproteobacteria bacterium]|nr:arsenosugar biosynthesis radical SAM protein ArsS [Gammaproteobacteria bacterium]MCP5407709.1 arsenosugar biosynthesis radical SAM protein ArsS [Chromatiaceae bacterium]MCP5441680.1 arsenosugar biosynthesis radical SAM protein ArsS [Chromatiaceae bacterium]
MLDTAPLLYPTTFPLIKRGRLETLQVNLGYLCNQTCKHCHVNAGPSRTELMTRETIDQVLELLAAHKVSLLDLTGGAPELNPHFNYLVEQARQLDVRVIDRCNLTILEEPGQEQLAGFLARQGVEVVASLPCYLKENVDNQRGKGVYDASIAGLKRLNRLGYGRAGSGLLLSLVFNPQGADLPPAQDALEVDYKQRLWDDHGISFNNLLTITNMPISRFGSTLLSKGQFESYMQLLKDSYRPDNLGTVMCRTLVSIDWQGYVYDCDFNQMLDLPIENGNDRRTRISDLLDVDLKGHSIKIGEHCYGCTAGQGSSCGGALSD